MPSTPMAQPALRPAYTDSTKPASSSDAPSLTLSSNVSGSSPSPYRAHFEPSTSTSDDELSPPPAHRLPSIQSGYAASKELSADEAPPRIPNRPARPAQRPQLKQAMQGNGTPAAASPEAPFVPSVTIKKDVTQTLGANFWASAAGASYDSQRAATPPAAELPSTQPAAESPAVGRRSPAGLPLARPPAAVAAAANFWEAASLAEPEPELPGSSPVSRGKATGISDAEKQAATPVSPAGQRTSVMPKPMHAPTPSTKLAANKFWQKAAERTFSDEAQPEETDPPTQAAAPADDRSPPRAVGPQRMNSQPSGAPAASGKRASARHLAARLRQQAAVRQSSLAAVMSGSVPLKEAASIRDTALRAMEGTGEGSPKGTPNGKALWMRAKSIAASGPEQDAALASRTKDLWMRGRTDSPTSEDASLQGASMQGQDSPSSLSVLLSDGSRQLSTLNSPFVTVLPGGDKSEAERADEALAQQLFRAAQARQKRQST
ncbi:g8189 [Coccomyxa viridis]|uniref:G8189 protein n=1 Tax=Coccomyxa viridis TaxID=1274662 RepID=A0ABP1G478_9CHLO